MFRLIVRVHQLHLTIFFCLKLTNSNWWILFASRMTKNWFVLISQMDSNCPAQTHAGLILFLTTITQGSYASENERRLLHHLFKTGYDKNERPVREDKDTVTLMFGLTLNQIVDVVRFTPLPCCHLFLSCPTSCVSYFSILLFSCLTCFLYSLCLLILPSILLSFCPCLSFPTPSIVSHCFIALSSFIHFLLFAHPYFSSVSHGCLLFCCTGRKKSNFDHERMGQTGW